MRRRRLPIVVLLIVVGVVYVGLLVLYAVSGRTTGVRAEVPAGGVLVVLTAEDVDSTGQRFAIDVDIVPAEAFVSEQTFTLARPLTVVIDPSTGTRELPFPAGQVPAVAPVELVMDGDIRQWPFDRYVTELVVGVFEGSLEDQRPVDITVRIDGRVQGWRLVAEEVDGPQQLEGELRFYRVEARRSGDTLAFAGILLLVMVALPVTALFVASRTYWGRRPVQPTFMSWMAAMLFATIPLRNFLPGSPPPGSWVDAVVVLWVIVALVGSLALYVAAWWEQGKPAGDRPA